MKFLNFTKTTIFMMGLFLLTIIFVLFNALLAYLIIPALVCLISALVLLSINLFKRYKLKKQQMLVEQEEIIMELATTEDGEKYVAQDSRYVHKLKKKIRNAKIELLLPFVVTVAIAVVFFGLLVRFVINLF